MHLGRTGRACAALITAAAIGCGVRRRIGSWLAVAAALALIACGEGDTYSDEEVASSCKDVERSIRHRADSLRDDPDGFLTFVEVEGHGTLPQLEHVTLCARARTQYDDRLEDLVQQYQALSDEAHGLRSRAASLPKDELVRSWRDLLARMAAILEEINGARQ